MNKNVKTVVLGLVRGFGMACTVGGGYAAGCFVGHKVYEKTGDYIAASVSGGMTGVVVAETIAATTNVAAATIEKA